MGLLATLLSTLNTQVTQRLAAAGYPALCQNADLSPGSILFGTAAQFETYAPPRIILEPLGSSFRTRDINSATARGSEERREQSVQRAIASDDLHFNVWCWGYAGTSQPVDDFDAARTLVHCVRASIHHIAPGAYQIEDKGEWLTGTNVGGAGKCMVMGLTIFTPILTSLLPYDATRQYVPPGTVPAFTETISLPSGTTETAPC